MSDVLREANIKIPYVQIPAETENVATTLLEEGYEWLLGVYEGAYKEVVDILKLLPPEQWDHYKMMDMHGTIEMRELQRTTRNLRRAIINKTRPLVFRKKKFNAKRQEKTSKTSNLERETEACDPGTREVDQRTDPS